MIVKYFRGNYTLGLGQPYVILSIDEDEKDFVSEKFIVFDGHDGVVTRKFHRLRYPKVDGIELESFIFEEIVNCKASINGVLFDKYKSSLDSINHNYKIELIESNSNIISFFLEMFKDHIDHFQLNTINEDLKPLIKTYKSLSILTEEL